MCVYVMGGVDEDITNSSSICSRKLRGFHACNHEHGNMCVSVYACMCVVCVCVCACMYGRVYIRVGVGHVRIHIQPWQEGAAVASDHTYADVF